MALRVHVIGAGRAGVGIARLLALADVEIGCVFARSAAAAALAAKRIGDGAPTTVMAEALTTRHHAGRGAGTPARRRPTRRGPPLRGRTAPRERLAAGRRARAAAPAAHRSGGMHPLASF
jgi:hypothetical protein